MKLFGTEKIKKLSLFDGIDQSIIEEILAGAARESFWPGEVIMEQWEEPNGKWYIIEHGFVDVWVNWDETAKLSAGDIFWEIALLNEEERSASVVSQSNVTVIVLSQDMLFEMINNDDNSINKEIMRRMEENLEKE